MKIINAGYQILSEISEGGIKELQLIERIGRVCYKSEGMITPDGESAKKFVKKLIASGHEAMLEHSSLSVLFTVDRGVTHELVRHRIMSFAQESTRYCNYTSDKKGMQFIKPAFVSNEDLDKAIELYKYSKSDLEKLLNSDKISNDIKCIFRWLEDIKTAETSYNYMIKNGWKPQQARAILPGCLKTEIVMTMNCRSLLNFIKLRTSNSAHPDIVVVAKEIEKIVTEICPEIFGNSKLK